MLQALSALRIAVPCENQLSVRVILCFFESPQLVVLKYTIWSRHPPGIVMRFVGAPLVQIQIAFSTLELK
jgi:hypothetical protein